MFASRALPADGLSSIEATRKVGLLLPRPLTNKVADRWLRSVSFDGATVVLDWLLLGGIADILTSLFPNAVNLPSLHWSPEFLVGISILNAALITLVGYSEGLYALNLDSSAQVRLLAKSVVLSTIVLCLGYLFQGSSHNAVASVCLSAPLHFGLLWLWRWRDRKGSEAPDAKAKNTVIVGAGAIGERVASYIQDHPECGRRFCGFVDDDKPLREGVVGRTGELATITRKKFIDEVVVAAPSNRNVTVGILREAKRLHLDVKIIPELVGGNYGIGEVEIIDGFPVIAVHAERLPGTSLRIKRVIDFVAAALGLILLSPVLIIIAALIKIDSPGPALYVAQRAGRKGRLFGCYKFRTMVSDADRLKDTLRHKNERSGPMFKIFDDPRITRVGRFLRHYSLDELPQLWNVLKGEMSLVGPRPHPLDDFAAYEMSHLGRLDVTPGITGLWQVSARRDPSFDRAMDLDREYIRTWSLRLDFKILVKTVRAVAQGSGN